MESAFWEQVVATGLRVPEDRPLDEMTADLTRMLGDPDPSVRDGMAFPTLGTWIHEGVYDQLLRGLGDGMCAGLEVGLGNTGDDTVFRRSFSALVVAECIDRNSATDLLDADVILRWGDRLASWYVREKDLRGFIAGQGWAHAVAHGADAIAALARAPQFGRVEMVVLLDVLADRLLLPTTEFLVAGEPDRIAAAVMHVLRRNLLDLDVLGPWVARLAAGAVPQGDVDHHPFHVAGNVQQFLRSLHLHLALSGARPAIRTDLLLELIEHLRITNSTYLMPPRRDARTH